MDTAAYLKGHGWRGLGYSLDLQGKGIAKPLLVSHKTDGLGLGQKKHNLSDQWWMRAFDESLKVLGTGKETTLSQIRTHGVSRGGLYGFFVKGQGLQGTFITATDSAASSSDSASASSRAQSGRSTPPTDHSSEMVGIKRKREEEEAPADRSVIVGQNDTADFISLDFDEAPGPKKKKRSKEGAKTKEKKSKKGSKKEQKPKDAAATEEKTGATEHKETESGSKEPTTGRTRPPLPMTKKEYMALSYAERDKMDPKIRKALKYGERKRRSEKPKKKKPPKEPSPTPEEKAAKREAKLEKRKVVREARAVRRAERKEKKQKERAAATKIQKAAAKEVADGLIAKGEIDEALAKTMTPAKVARYVKRAKLKKCGVEEYMAMEKERKEQRKALKAAKLEKRKRRKIAQGTWTERGKKGGISHVNTS